jgi:hypothetical protein
VDDDHVRQEVEKTLDLLAATPRVTPRPFFYTRLRARMQGNAAPAHGFARLLRDRLALAALGVALLVAINTFSLLHLATQSSEAQKEQAIASFAKEYSISTYQY